MGPKFRTRRIGANPEQPDLVNFRGPDWRKLSELCAFAVFFRGKTDKMLPKSRFSKPIFGHSAGQLNWTGPIVTQGSPAEPLSCKKTEFLQFSGIVSWYKILRPWGRWQLCYTLQTAPILSQVALLQHRDLVGVGTRKHAPHTTNCKN